MLTGNCKPPLDLFLQDGLLSLLFEMLSFGLISSSSPKLLSESVDYLHLGHRNSTMSSKKIKLCSTAETFTILAIRFTSFGSDMHLKKRKSTLPDTCSILNS